MKRQGKECKDGTMINGRDREINKENNDNIRTEKGRKKRKTINNDDTSARYRMEHSQKS